MTPLLPPPPLIRTGRQFVILKKVGPVAIMGGCTRCGRKFFTPSEYSQAVGAEDYLRGKFGDHECNASGQT